MAFTTLPMAIIYKDVWGEANPSVAFMMIIDAVVVWLGMIVFILAYQKPQAGLEKPSH
jgi:hypothetical protein